VSMDALVEMDREALAERLIPMSAFSTDRRHRGG